MLFFLRTDLDRPPPLHAIRLSRMCCHVGSLRVPMAAGTFYPFTCWLLNSMAVIALSSIPVTVNALGVRHSPPFTY